MISVIIPIFNSSEYIGQCVESILTQTYQDFEVLLVDDGSTDNTGLICKEYANKDNRVKYFYKENSGVSDTRNYGLNHAIGKYIMFIDSDDFFCDNTVFKKCVELANNNESSLIAFNIKILQLDNSYKNYEPYNLENANSMIDIISCCIAPIKLNMNIYPLFRAVWGKLFNREIIEQYNIRFDYKMYYSEDEIFLLSYLKHVDKVVDANIFGLIYRNHPGSLTRRYIKGFLEQSTIKLRHIEELYRDLFDNITIKTALYEFIWKTYYSLYVNEKRNKYNPKYICKAWLKDNKDILKFKINKNILSKSSKVYFYIYKFTPIFIPLLNKIRYIKLKNK